MCVSSETLAGVGGLMCAEGELAGGQGGLSGPVSAGRVTGAARIGDASVRGSRAESRAVARLWSDIPGGGTSGRGWTGRPGTDPDPEGIPGCPAQRSG